MILISYNDFHHFTQSMQLIHDTVKTVFISFTPKIPANPEARPPIAPEIRITR